MKARDAFEMENLGKFRRVYPSEDPAKQKHYDKLL